MTTITPGSAEHRRLVTASKVGAIIGVSPYQSPAAMWLLIAGQVDPEPPTEAMRRGTNQETHILDWFFTELHPELDRQAGETTWTRPDMDWAAANTDAHATTPDGDVVFIEAKSVARDSNNEWGEPYTDEIPLTYYVQTLWSMHMTHHQDGPQVTRTYVVKHGPWIDQYDVYLVDYDPQVALALEGQCHTFWRSLQDPAGCPEPSNMVGEHQRFTKLHEGIDQGFDWEISHDLAADYLRAKADKKNAQAREDGAKARILKAMGTAHTASCNGITIGYRRPTKNGVSFYPPQKHITLDHITPAATAV